MRLWSIRLVLEAAQHPAAFFVTLTYAPEFYPEDGNVSPRELQLFLKRLRLEIAPQRLRFYGVGEYGERSGRAHYHLAVFGGFAFSDFQRAVNAAWAREGKSLGFVFIGTLTMDSAAYIASYLCKGMTKASAVKLKGRAPEFARMSRRPGIGAWAHVQVADQAKKFGIEPVPNVVRFNNRLWPLGRYLRGLVARRLGLVKDRFQSCIRSKASPLDISMLQRQAELYELAGREKREARRAMSALLADGRQRRANSMKAI